MQPSNSPVLPGATRNPPKKALPEQKLPFIFANCKTVDDINAVIKARQYEASNWERRGNKGAVADILDGLAWDLQQLSHHTRFKGIYRDANGILIIPSNGQIIVTPKTPLAHRPSWPVSTASTSNNSSFVPSNQPLRFGANGDHVKKLQNQLNVSGANPPLVVDGSFGPKTIAAIGAFQAANEILVTGIIGAKTAKALLGKQIKPEPKKKKLIISTKAFKKALSITQISRRRNYY